VECFSIRIRVAAIGGYLQGAVGFQFKYTSIVSSTPHWSKGLETMWPMARHPAAPAIAAMNANKLKALGMIGVAQSMGARKYPPEKPPTAPVMIET
jgi:hypothetical protein